VFAFLLSLLPMAAIEITSFGRLGILAAFLASKERPIGKGLAFVVGTFLCYMLLGVLIAVGLGQVFKRAGGGLADRLFNPQTIDYVISLPIGLLLVAAAVRMFLKPSPGAGVPDTVGTASVSKSGLVVPFITGIWSNAVAGPALLVSFAAFGQILKAEFSIPVTLLVLAYYNLLVVSPLIFFTWLTAMNRQRAERIFGSIRRGGRKLGRWLVPALCLLIGLVMIADSVGFFMGHPLLPTGSKGSDAAP